LTGDWKGTILVPFQKLKKGRTTMPQEFMKAIDISFMLVNFACFFTIVGLNIMRIIKSIKGDKGKADYYKFLSMQASVCTIFVVALTVSVKAVLGF
jgi:hypothetical protein